MPRIGTVIREVYQRPGADAVPGHLARRYGIRITGTARLDAGVLRVEHDAGPPWVARLFVSARPVSRAEQDAEVLGYLQRQQIAAERPAHPEPVSVLDGRAVLVTEFVAGQRPPNTPASARRLGDLLGRLAALPTETGAAGRPAGSLHHLPAYEGGPEQDLAAAAAMLADLAGRVPPRYRQTYDALTELLDRGDDCRGLPESFVHPDPARSNAISTQDGPVLVDWTGAGRGPRVASLAVLLQSTGPRRARQVLAGYQAHAKLTGEEIGRLEGVLWIRPLWLACWQCWLSVVSPRVDKVFLPDAEYIAALAASVRECLV